MDLSEKFEEKLKRLIIKHGKKNIKASENEKSEEDYQDEDYQDEQNESDERQSEFLFHYDKRKGEFYSFSEDLKIKKDKSGKNEFYIVFFDEKIADNLREISGDPDMYHEPPEISVESLCHCINDLRIKYQVEKYHHDSVKKILDFTEDLFGDKYKKMNNMINEGIIDFDSLWYHLDKIDSIYVVKYLDEDICFKYKFFTYVTDTKDEALILFGNIIAPYNHSLNIYEMQYTIRKFSGTKKIDTIKINLLQEQENDQAKAIEYGDKVIQLSQKIHHLSLHGKQYTPQANATNGFSHNHLSTSNQTATMMAFDRHERIIVDYEGMIKYFNNPFDFFLEKSIDLDNLTTEDKIIILPFACIYNLGTNKEWGLTHVKNLSEINYKKDAFDHLVLEKEKKSIIKSLITNKVKSEKYQDFVEGKGNGLVFLLYGNTGTGKTFSTEATCEFLQKPMYNITAGDLGIDPDHMEEIMNMILEYSKRWDAIIVIDEVDVFLEERETNMITRNAMVGIFLKLLEYHNGIIFLTTNRLTSLDPAIKSRINIMLSYKELSEIKRRQIWKSLFEKWNLKIKDTTLDQLAEYKLNGREIRNYMKIVVVIHEDQNKEITDQSFISELKKCFEITEEFSQSIDKNLYI
jgi:AAA+ superfamily predicted ATPase